MGLVKKAIRGCLGWWPVISSARLAQEAEERCCYILEGPPAVFLFADIVLLSGCMHRHDVDLRQQAVPVIVVIMLVADVRYPFGPGKSVLLTGQR